MKLEVIFHNGELLRDATNPYLVEITTDENGEISVMTEEIIPKTEDELRKVIEKTIRCLEMERLNKILDQYGYDEGLVGVQTYAQRNDPEAQALWDFYLAYDDAIWAYIGSLTTKTMEELLQDVQILQTIENQIFEQVIQENPLP